MRCMVNVTQEDIDGARKCDSTNCAVAKAILHADIPQMKSVAVGPIIGYVYLEDDRDLFFRLPAEVALFIRHFDQGKRVEPFSFELELESEVQK